MKIPDQKKNIFTDKNLASYAVNENFLGSRIFIEDQLPYFKTPFAIDYDRIINSSAFRRLQYKTQVFVNHQGDHYRTRLTHSIEVAQIARSIADALSLNRDLAENISLAHDLGHPPFGHAGEDALNLKMQDFDGFSHNAHTLKIITFLENRFSQFDGLNLSWEAVEGIVKHNGRYSDLSKVEKYILQYNQIFDLKLDQSPSLEAQVSSIADDIAYNNHDLEDGLRAELFVLEDLEFLPMIGEVYHQILDQYPNLKREILVGEAKQRITNLMITDVIENTKINLLKNNIFSVDQVRNHHNFLVDFSCEMKKIIQILKSFLMNKMYRHPLVNDMTNRANQVIGDLFDHYFINYQQYLDIFKNQNLDYSKPNFRSQIIADYIAGMTDRFALSKHKTILKK
jgi:dGTPase